MRRQQHGAQRDAGGIGHLLQSLHYLVSQDGFRATLLLFPPCRIDAGQRGSCEWQRLSIWFAKSRELLLTHMPSFSSRMKSR